MKKIILAALTGILSQFGLAQTVATNFTCNDCASVSHDLFTELDAGKVIVICWVMPCATCIPPASTDAAAVQSFASSNPGMVKFYLVDDAGNTSCSSLTGWASSNGITTSAAFGNSGTPIRMTDYGTAGMPKTVVLGGGACHSVFYNQNGTVSSSAVIAAINNALAPCTGIIENSNSNMELSVFPNPSLYHAKITYTLTHATNVSIDLLNILGEKVNTVAIGVQSPGKQEYQVNVASLSEGIYFIKLNAGEESQAIKFTVIR